MDLPQQNTFLKRIIFLNVFLLIIAVFLAVFLLPQIALSETGDTGDKPLFESCDFAVEEKAYDINPGREFVLYTNYACPYCASFYNAYTGEDYTTRILLLDKDAERFASQELVSSFMLRIYRDNPATFSKVESILFSGQDYWTKLSSSDLLDWLNELAQTQYTIADLENELNELKQAETDAPTDLKFVPALYSEKQRWDGLVLDVVG